MRNPPPDLTQVARATSGYDPAFERRLTDALMGAIVETSRIDNCLVLRLGELAAALTTVLASMLALSPTTARSPAAIRKTAEGFRKKLIANVSAAECGGDFYEFRQRTFRDDDRERGGHG